MPFLEKITSYNQIQNIISEQDKIILFYLSHPDCGVCHVIKPRIADLLDRYPQINGYDVDLTNDPAIGGQMAVHTVPAVLMYMNKREILREARFIVMDTLEPQIIRLLNNFDIITE